MKRNFFILGVLVLSGIIVLAYAAGKQSNWLTDNQINFSDKLSTNHGNKLEAEMWNGIINGLTTRAQNHETRLQAFAQSSGYPNLTAEQLIFTDLLSTKHNNQLTAEMWDGLVNKLTMVVTNHEMRLRAINIPTSTEGRCVGEYQSGTGEIYVSKEVYPNKILCLQKWKEPGSRRERWYPAGDWACIWKREGNRIIGVWDRLSLLHNSRQPDANGNVYSRWFWQWSDLRDLADCNYSDGTVDITSCEYLCTPVNYDTNTQYCERKMVPVMKNCNTLNKSACKVEQWCTWQQ